MLCDSPISLLGKFSHPISTNAFSVAVAQSYNKTFTAGTVPLRGSGVRRARVVLAKLRRQFDDGGR